jgi:uncharacterized protein (DUF58 family)
MINELPIILLIMLVIAVMLRLDFVFYLIYVLAGVYIMARWWPSRSVKHIQMRRHFSDHAFLGETVPVELEVENISWLPVPWLRADETSPPTLLAGNPVHQVISLKPHEKVILPYELVGRRRGYYEIGPARLSLGDLFGFSEVNAQLEQRDHLTVYPRVIPLAKVELVSRSPHGTIRSRQPIFEDPDRIIGVRDYLPGDPLHGINWKSSARASKLLVKKLEPAVSLSSMIVLDLDRDAYDYQLRHTHSEWAIVVAASLAHYLTEQRQAIGLASNGRDSVTQTAQWSIPPRPGRVHLMKLLEWLARVEMIETVSLPEWLPTAVHALPWGTVVIVVTPKGDETTCRALHRLQRAGLSPVLVVVEPHGQFGAVRERARRLGFPAHLVSDERDLARWQARAPVPYAA